jgi:hypothetical protein
VCSSCPVSSHICSGDIVRICLRFRIQGDAEHLHPGRWRHRGCKRGAPSGKSVFTIDVLAFRNDSIFNTKGQDEAVLSKPSIASRRGRFAKAVFNLSTCSAMKPITSRVSLTQFAKYD